MTSDASAGALDGVRVLEVGSLIAGPFAGRLLADLGADVIKIEAPTAADPLRDWGQGEVDGHHLFWTSHARNKRCITLDLRKPIGQELFLDLARHADVVVESFRPGTLERWNLGYEQLHAVNPRLVLARVSGYGQTGPSAHQPGYAAVAEGISGIRHLEGFPDRPPPRIALSLGDSLAGMFAMQGVLAALFARERLGRGQVVDVALTEACLAITESTIADYDRAGLVRGPAGTKLEGIAPSNVYRTSDDQWMIVAANQDTVFGRLSRAMGRPQLATDPRFADHVLRGRNQDELDEIVAEWVGTLDAAALLDTLTQFGVVCGPVNTAAEVVRDPQLLARGMLVPHFDERVGADVLAPGIVPKLSHTPGRVRWAGPPRPGYHNEQVFTELLELDRDELAKLGVDGVI